MPLSTFLRNVGASTGTSLIALDVFADSTLTTMQASPEGDTKKLLIAGATSIITQVLIKLIEKYGKRKSTKKSDSDH